MSKNFTVDTTEFNAAARAMSRLSGNDFADVVRAEVEPIMKGAARRTAKGSKSKKEIKEAARAHASSTAVTGGYVSVNQKPGKLGTETVWAIVTDEGQPKKFAINGSYRWGNARWQKLLRMVTDYSNGGSSSVEVKRRIAKYANNRAKAKGLAKNSWGLLNEQVNKGKVFNKSARANKRKGSFFNLELFIPRGNARVTENSGRTKYTITLTNRSPAANNKNARGGFALKDAIRARATAYTREAGKGTFDNLDEAVKKFPGVKIKR